MSKYKKGYTLIELVVVMAIILIIGTIVINLGFYSTSHYLNVSNEIISIDNFDNAMLNIDMMCNKSTILSIECNERSELGKGNNIIIKYSDDEESTKKVIYLSGDRLLVNTVVKKDKETTEGSNVVLRDVEKFEVLKKGKLIYYTIKTKKSGERVRCI